MISEIQNFLVVYFVVTESFIVYRINVVLKNLTYTAEIQKNFVDKNIKASHQIIFWKKDIVSFENFFELSIYASINFCERHKWLRADLTIVIDSVAQIVQKHGLLLFVKKG